MHAPGKCLKYMFIKATAFFVCFGYIFLITTKSQFLVWFTALIEQRNLVFKTLCSFFILFYAEHRTFKDLLYISNMTEEIMQLHVELLDIVEHFKSTFAKDSNLKIHEFPFGGGKPICLLN